MNREIVFADKQLERIIRDILNKPNGDITPEDMVGIKRLNIDTMVYDVSPVAYCLQLESLMIAASEELDLRPFSALPNLRLVDITEPTENELKALELFVNLRSLSIIASGSTNVKFKRYSHLRNLRSVRYIDICAREFDCEDLSEFDYIEKLSLCNVSLKNTVYLQKLIALKELILNPVSSDNYIQLRATLENMPSLIKVEFNNSSMDAKQLGEFFSDSKWNI